MMDYLELYTLWWIFKLDLEALEEVSSMNLDAFLSNLSPLVRERFDPEFVKVQRERLKSSGAKIVSIWDRSYPRFLKEIPKPPPFLFCLGNVSTLEKEMFSIVGTRKATSYGMGISRKFSSEMAKHFVVVSGMAYGIDSKAHEGALETGRTIAVLASGVDVPSPRGNASLYRRIVENGCVLSVYPLGEEAKKHRFPERNAIIAGLSVGTLVVEAPLKSGAIITAGYAADFGRDVFAIPGDIGRYQSEGTNFLIKNGAILVISPSDVLSFYGLESEGVSEEDEIVDLIRRGFDTVDSIVQKTGMSVDEVLTKVSELELMGYLINDGGKLRVL